MHVPNGGKRPRGEAGKLKAMGAKKGFPDLVLPRRCGQWTGLAIELKAPDGYPTKEQKEWLAALEEEGYLTGICRTSAEFRALLDAYLTG